MEEANESAWLDLINFWAREYERLFYSHEGDVSMPPQEKVPEEEMQRYVDNYKRWFENKADLQMQQEKLSKLQLIEERWKLDLETLTAIIGYMKACLGE